MYANLCVVQKLQGPLNCLLFFAGSFVQANYGAFQAALASIAKAVPGSARHVVELHAGEEKGG